MSYTNQAKEWLLPRVHNIYKGVLLYIYYELLLLPRLKLVNWHVVVYCMH